MEASFPFHGVAGWSVVLKFRELSLFSEGSKLYSAAILPVRGVTNRPLVCGAARRARQLDGKRPVDPRGWRGAKNFQVET
ncbi:MAG TPA: hypothetical protein VFV61_11340 [Pyrinomonadaceae bacterium]|nr:hypothetical protein [Pyrinomonadaceae bacterium]